MIRSLIPKISIFLATVLGLSTSLIIFSLSDVNAQTENVSSSYSISISKDATSGLIITDGTSYVSGFDTSYTIEGNQFDYDKGRDLVVSTISEDFSNSPTSGYIKFAETNSSNYNASAIVNPFASKEQIREKVESVLNVAIDSVFEDTDVSFTIGSMTEVIKCTFGETLDSFECSKVGGFKFFGTLFNKSN